MSLIEIERFKFGARLAAVALGAALVAGPGAAATAEQEIQALVESGKLEAALTLTERQLAQEKGDAALQFLKGIILARMNRLDDAQLVFEEITSEHPELPEPFNNLAVIYAAKGDLEKAQQALQMAINTHPAYATAHENMGDIYAKLASQAYNQALQLDEDNASAKAKLSMVENLFSLPRATAVAMAPAPEPRPAPPAPPVVESEPQAIKAPPPEPPAAEPAVAEPEVETEPAPAPVAEASPPAAEPAPVPAPDQTAIIESVRRAVDEWARAWSSQDVEAYLGFYSQEFQPPQGMSRSGWEDLRRDRVSGPRYINVEISGTSVALLGSDHAQATFDQKYESDTYGDRVTKSILFKNENGRWMIVEERSE